MKRPDEPAVEELPPPSIYGINAIFGAPVLGMSTAFEMNAALMRHVVPIVTRAEIPPGDDFDLPCCINYHHWHPNAAMMDRLRKMRAFEGRKNVGFWIGETTGVLPEWIRAAQAFDEIWTGSEWFARILRIHLAVPVHVIPHPIPVPDGFQERETQNRKSGFTVLFSFDAGSRVTRKNPHLVVQAFRKAFPDNEPVKLILKTHGAKLGALDFIKVAAAHDSRIELINKRVEPDEMVALYRRADLFCSLHAGEGFGLHLAEAMREGCVTMATAFSGNTDFMNGGNSVLVPFETTPVDDEFFAPGVWAKPDVDAAAERMRQCWECYDSAMIGSLRRNAFKTIKEKLNPELVLNLIHDRIKILNGDLK